MSALGTETVHALFMRVAAGEHVTLPTETWGQGVHLRQKLNNIRSALRRELGKAESSLARGAEGAGYTENQRLRLNTLVQAAETCVFRLVPATCPEELRSRPATILCEPTFDAGDALSKALRAAGIGGDEDVARGRDEAGEAPTAPAEENPTDKALRDLGFIKPPPPPPPPEDGRGG